MKNIYEDLIRVRDMVSFEKDPENWMRRADVLAQITAQAFANERKKDEIPKGFYINHCELSTEELKQIFVLLDLPVSRMKIEVTYTDPETNQLFVEVISK